MVVRVIGLTQGKISDPMASSGLNSTVFSALGKQVELVDVMDVSLRGWRKYLLAARTWHPDRALWHERYDQNVESFNLLSQLADEKLSQFAERFDLVFQLKTLFSPGSPPGKWPYVIMTDNTYALSDRSYRPWAPLNKADKAKWITWERETYQKARAVFARTHWLRQSLIEDYGVPEEKVVWVGTGSHFKPDSVPLHKAQDDGRTVLFIGKEFERKGVPTLVKAFEIVRKSCPDARLLLVGREAKYDIPGVEVLGKINDRGRIRELYQQASIFALPAIFDPTPNVVTEAMTFHLPCVVSNGGGLSELVVDGETGYVIQPSNPEILADRIIDLLNNPEKRVSMGEQGFQRIQNVLNWNLVVERMLPYLN
jgi:alpha-maltose-1-phosphate synthase